MGPARCRATMALTSQEKEAQESEQESEQGDAEGGAQGGAPSSARGTMPCAEHFRQLDMFKSLTVKHSFKDMARDEVKAMVLKCSPLVPPRPLPVPLPFSLELLTLVVQLGREEEESNLIVLGGWGGGDRAPCTSLPPKAHTRSRR